MNWRLPDVTLSSISGVYDSTQGAYDNFDNTVYAQALDAQHDRDNQLSQEFRAATTFSGPLNFTWARTTSTTVITWADTDKIFPLGPYPVAGPYFGDYNTLAMEAADINKNYSAFGQVSWKILENLEFAFGARYSHDDRSADIKSVFNAFDAIAPAADNPFAPAGSVFRPHIVETNTSPEGTLTFHPTHDITLYGAYKTGYLAGGVANPANLSNYNLQANPTESLTYGQEKVRGGEVGLKGLFLDNKVQAELTFFDYKYTGLQVETFDPAPCPTRSETPAARPTRASSCRAPSPSTVTSRCTVRSN